MQFSVVQIEFRCGCLVTIRPEPKIVVDQISVPLIPSWELCPRHEAECTGRGIYHPVSAVKLVLKQFEIQ